MAIAKIIYKENASATPEVWMDTTDKTAAAGNMLSGTTALKNDGTTATGNIATKTSSDMTVSGATVTAPAGYYASDASKSVASGSATTPATTVTANPSISVSSGGLITASVSASQNVTPTVSAGYVSSGTAGTVSVSGSNTEQLSTQAAQTIHPSTTDQTIASGKYLTGTQTIKAVTTTNLTAANIAEGVTVKIGDSTDDDCVASITGTHQGGTTPTGVKYIWTDVDGEGAWDVSDYAKCSVDGAPVGGNVWRLWFKVDQTTGLSVSVLVYARATKVIIDWGDGNSEYATGSTPYTNTHTYADSGVYVVCISDPTNNRMNPREYTVGQSNDNANTTLVAVELYSTNAVNYNASIFRNCTALKKARIMNGEPNSYLFTHCASLKDVIIPDWWTSISSSMFNDTGLEKITIPAGISSIEVSAFSGCAALLEVHLMPTSPPTLSSNVFLNTSSSMVIYVPYSSDHSILSAYQSATNWSTYASQMQEEPQ